MHQTIVDNKSYSTESTEGVLRQKLGGTVPTFENLRYLVEKPTGIRWTKQVMPLTKKNNIIPSNDIHTSSLTWFFLQYQVWLTSNHLNEIINNPILLKWNNIGSTTDNKQTPLDNLYMTNNHKVKNMRDLSLLDDETHIRSPSSVALWIFKVVNTQFWEHQEIITKRTRLINVRKTMTKEGFFLDIQLQN